MKWVYSMLSVFFVAFLVFPKDIYAIIFLPALILIPIAKIVALVVGGIALPSIGLGVIWHKLFGSSLVKVFIAVILLLLFVGISLIVFFKIRNPYHPLF